MCLAGMVAGSDVRILAQLQAVQAASTPEPSRSKASRQTAAQAGVQQPLASHIAQPPPELLLLTTSSTVRDVHAAAEEAYSNVYLMFSQLKVSSTAFFPSMCRNPLPCGADSDPVTGHTLPRPEE